MRSGRPLSTETNVLKQLLKREHWLEYGELINQSMFPTQEHTKLFSLIREYHEGGLGLPDTPDLKVKALRSLLEASGIDKANEQVAFSEVLSSLGKEDRDPTPGVTAALVQNFKRRSAVRQMGAHVFALEELDGDAFDMRWAQVMAAANQLVNTDEEYSAAEIAPAVLSELETLEWEYGPRVPVGFSPKIDEALGGGMPMGWIGCIIAPTHRGKTLVLKNMGHAALLSGLNVAHITLETPGGIIARDYYSLLSGLSLKETDERQKDAISSYKKGEWGELFLYDMRGRGCTIHTLERVIRRLVAKTPISLLLVDYLEMLDRSDDLPNYQALGGDMRLLQKLGTNYKFAVWTAAQTNRYGTMDGIPKEHHIQASYLITQISDVNMILYQDETEKAMGTLHCSLSKNRPGGVTMTTTFKVDYQRLSLRDAGI